MDSAVSWQRSIIISKLQYPKADYSTIIHLAKQIYLIQDETYEKYLTNNSDVSYTKRNLKKEFLLQGADV